MLTKEQVEKDGDRAYKAVAELLSCQTMIVNLHNVNSRLIGACGRLAERLEAIHE